MPIEIKDCDNGIGNIIEARGTVDDREMIDFFEGHLRQDEEKFKIYRYSLIDFTAVPEMDVSNETVRHVADLCITASKVNPYPILAFAADSDLIYGLSRMYEALVGMIQWETMVFRSRKVRASSMRYALVLFIPSLSSWWLEGR